MKVLVTGSRDWTDEARIRMVLSEFILHGESLTVIEGGARGADEIAGRLADEMGFTRVTVKADWEKFGRSAGPIRNRAMLAMEPDLVLGFCKNGSRGTMDCIHEASRRGVETRLYVESSLWKAPNEPR